MKIGPFDIDTGRCLVIAELGANHNGDLDVALRMIEAAKAAGADLVKFQKRAPSICVPAEQRGVIKETPWGPMPYLAYRERLEFWRSEYDAIDEYCRANGIPWFASPWDLHSVEFLSQYDLPALKIASPCLTDHELLLKARATGRPILASTGMSSVREIADAVRVLGLEDLVLLACRSTYPCPPEDLNLAAIQTLKGWFGVPVGYSGHETGLWTTLCAVAMGACVVERHFTLDRAMWGTDQAASVEPQGLAKLVQQIRRFEQARGDGAIRVLPSELPIRAKLRRVITEEG